MLSVFRQIEETGEEVIVTDNDPDPADRTIVATARHFGCPLVTPDARILTFYPNSIW